VLLTRDSFSVVLFYVICVFCRLFVRVRLSVPVQVIDWKESFLKWPIICCWGRKTLLPHTHVMEMFYISFTTHDFLYRDLLGRCLGANTRDNMSKAMVSRSKCRCYIWQVSTAGPDPRSPSPVIICVQRRPTHPGFRSRYTKFHRRFLFNWCIFFAPKYRQQL